MSRHFQFETMSLTGPTPMCVPVNHRKTEAVALAYNAIVAAGWQASSATYSKQPGRGPPALKASGSTGLVVPRPE
jgi:hypothetical protein